MEFSCSLVAKLNDIDFQNDFNALKKKTFVDSINNNSFQFQVQLQAVRTCTSFPNPKLMPSDEVDLNAQPNVEIVHNPPEWKYVEQILPAATVPKPTPKTEYPSGWSPQKPEAFKHPYFLPRSRNYMVPVYLLIDYRGTRKRTAITHIHGDIWQLHSEIMQYIEHYMAKKERSRVNEFTQQIIINGDYVNLIKDFLVKKGF